MHGFNVYCLRLVFYFNNFVDENFVEMVLRFAACEQLETAFLNGA